MRTNESDIYERKADQYLTKKSDQRSVRLCMYVVSESFDSSAWSDRRLEKTVSVIHGRIVVIIQHTVVRLSFSDILYQVP